MKEMIAQHPRLGQVSKELKGTKVKTFLHEDRPIDDQFLLRLLPRREIADQLVQIYLDTFETTYRVLHLPSFWAEYSDLWMEPENAKPAFMVVVLLMLAATNCIHGQDPTLFRGDSSLGRETACEWIGACEGWLAFQSQKHIEISALQAQCILFIAKKINSVKRKRTWVSECPSADYEK